MPNQRELVDWLTGIVFGGVAITTAAIQNASDDEELTFVQWRAVLFVGEATGGSRVGEVARLIDASLPATSRLLRRLEQRGLLTLVRDEADRRATVARLTQRGVALRTAVLEYRRNEIARLVKGISASPDAAQTLRRLAEAFDARGHATPGAQKRQESANKLLARRRPRG